MGQRSMRDFTTRPEKRQNHTHTTRAQEDAPEQQSRKPESNYDTGYNYN